MMQIETTIPQTIGRPRARIDFDLLQLAADLGETTAQASQRLGISTATFKTRLRDNHNFAAIWKSGAEARRRERPHIVDRPPKKVWSSEDLEVVERCAESGMTAANTASLVGLSRDGFSYWKKVDDEVGAAWARGKAKETKEKPMTARSNSTKRSVPQISIAPDYLRARAAAGDFLWRIASDVGVSPDILRRRVAENPELARAFAEGKAMAIMAPFATDAR